MSKKTMMILALSCLISLGIGFFIGYGLNVQNLAGTAAAPNGITNPTGGSNINNREEDIQTLIMRAQLERAEAIDAQLNEQLKVIQERMAFAAEAQTILFEARSLRPAKDTDKAKMTATIAEFCKEQKIQIIGAVGADLSQREWEQNIESLKAFIDQLNAASQQDMIRMQELSNKRNEAFDVMANFLAKNADILENVVRGRK